MFMRKIAAAAALSIIAVSSANALTTTPYQSPLSGGDSSLANAIATAGESFGGTELSFTAADWLNSFTSITINPFNATGGFPANSISLSYAVNGGETTALDIIPTPSPFNSPNASATGSSFLEMMLNQGDTLSFFINGSAGASGNQVTFATNTAAVPLPAAGLLYLAGVGGVVALRRKRKASKA